MAVDEVAQLKNRLKDARANAQKAEDGLRDIKAALRQALGDETSNLDQVRIAQHQRILEQYIYRDRLIVQEFYFSIVATGIAVKFVTDPIEVLLGVAISAAMFLLMLGLWVHIGHLRTDRNLMWEEANRLEDDLDFQVMRKIWSAGYAGGDNQRKISGTSLMVKSVGVLSIIWVLICVYFVFQVWDLAPWRYLNTCTAGP